MKKKYYFYANPYQEDSIRAAACFADALRDCCLTAPAWLCRHIPSLSPAEETPADARCALAFGGDGTLLRLAPDAAIKQVPMLGVHTGKVGFLMQGTCEDAQPIARFLQRDPLPLKAYPMLRITAPGADSLALNDVSITRGNHPGVMAISVQTENETIFTPHGDGVIVSTPLGSTAYTLASGGPIVHPDTQALIVTPVSARELLSRPVVLPNVRKMTLTVPPLRRDCAQLSIDGQTLLPLCGESRVEIALAREQALFVQWRNTSFFDTLRQKTALWNEM